MITHTSKNGNVMDLVHTAGATDYIDSNGNIQTNEQQAVIMVRDSSDLSNLIEYSPGTIAYTAGFVYVWQKSSNGEWVSI